MEFKEYSEIAERRDALEREILRSSTKKEKYRPFAGLLLSSALTITYPFSLGAMMLGTSFIEMNESRYNSFLYVATAPTQFIRCLKEVICPSTRIRVFDKSALSRNPSASSLALKGRSRRLYDDYEPFYTPNEKEYSSSKYFIDIGREKFEEYCSLKEMERSFFSKSKSEGNDEWLK